jgi:hypothetical protein
MSDASPALDEAYERMARSGFELPNGFVNHGPMACEALAALGCEDDVDDWARRFARVGGTAIDAEAPFDFEWQDALGDYRRLPEWIGHFERSIADDGWLAVVEIWVPRLMPALAVALFHGAIRAAHAVRAIDAVDSPARRAELARALAYWAARFRVGEPAAAGVGVEAGPGGRPKVGVGPGGRPKVEAGPGGRPGGSEHLRLALVDAAADGARRYLTQPNIFNLHGVTGAMAVELMADHVSPDAGAAGLAQVHAEHASMYRDTAPTEPGDLAGVPGDLLARTAADSRDPHQVKLVEACRRGYAASGDLTFAAAAEAVTGLSG